MISQKEMLDLLQAQLAIDFNCTVDNLNGEQDSIVFVEAKENPGRRRQPLGERSFDILSMGKSIVVSASPERLAIAKTLMQGKDRDTIFSLPIIRGYYLHYLPDLARLKPISAPVDFSYELIEQDEVASLLGLAGFDNALIYDANHPYQTVLVLLARQAGKIVAMAGACDPWVKIRQLGITVLPAYRRCGLAAYLISSLTWELLQRGYLPTYDVDACNLASQRVAYRVGYYPAWITDRRCDFKGLEAPLSSSNQ